MTIAAIIIAIITCVAIAFIATRSKKEPEPSPVVDPVESSENTPSIYFTMF